MTTARTLKALIVDDQATMRSLLRTVLRQIGVVEVAEAADGEEALQSALASPVNLIISDFNMPKSDGLELLRAVRSRPPIKATAFIMLTGQTDRDLVIRARDNGANNFIVKPFSTASVRQKIEAVFGGLT